LFIHSEKFLHVLSYAELGKVEKATLFAFYLICGDNLNCVATNTEVISYVSGGDYRKDVELDMIKLENENLIKRNTVNRIRGHVLTSEGLIRARNLPGQ